MRDMDRDGAVVALTQLGFAARARDWALGRTVFVTLPELREEHDGGILARDVLYLREEPEGWCVLMMEPTAPGGPERRFATVPEAAGFMRAWLDCGVAIQTLEQRGFYVRRRPVLGDGALFVTRRRHAFNDGEGLHGWRRSLVLRRESGAWGVVTAVHGEGPRELASLPDLDAVADFLEEHLDTA